MQNDKKSDPLHGLSLLVRAGGLEVERRGFWILFWSLDRGPGVGSVARQDTDCADVKNIPADISATPSPNHPSLYDRASFYSTVMSPD